MHGDILSGRVRDMIAKRSVFSYVKCIGLSRLAGWCLHRLLTNKQNKGRGNIYRSFFQGYAADVQPAP